MSGEFDLFLRLIRLGVGRGPVPASDSFDWLTVKDIAERQGLSAVVLDGIEKLPELQRPPKVFLLEWIGETLQGYEYRYDQYRQAIAELAGFYNNHGFKMMVLKGYACSIDWPKPEHRPCGDIDIWLFGQQKEADDALAKVKGIEIDSSHHHHTVFNWGEFAVENHYDFINVHRYHSNVKFEQLLKELGKDDTHFEILFDQRVYLPSATLHALFLLRHSMMDFVSSSLSLRQILDWAFFVEKHTDEIDWKWLNGKTDEYHMNDFVSCINAICVEDLGFEASIFHSVQFNPQLKDRVLNDIINPAFGKSSPKALLPRLYYMYKRWRGNGWKQELCFSESRWNNFWGGIRNHIVKPKV